MVKPKERILTVLHIARKFYVGRMMPKKLSHIPDNGSGTPLEAPQQPAKHQACQNIPGQERDQ